MKEIITTIKIDDDGNVIGTSTETKVIEEEKEEIYKFNQYSKVFDASSPLYTKDQAFNYHVLHSQERYANDKLKVKGHLFLNEVYDMLGLTRTKAGQVVGWIYEGGIKNRNNFVEFEVFSCCKGKDGMVINFLGCKNILDLI